ncbi:MAG: cupin domain-containing protein, partial [Chloroflexaceae bacterium]|nr:cupin domain-containing protein [Chloroflexaceae bacterium]
MQAFETNDLLRQQQASHEPYLEFLRESTCSAGLYVLPAGGVDEQQPHTEDEIYVVMRGRGVIRVATEDRPVAAGSVVFGAAGVEHRFHSISEELAVRVVFAPAEGSQ